MENSGHQPSVLKEKDVEVFEIIEREKQRQLSSIELIASENFTSQAVLECLGSCMTNKYSEGYPSARYYGGTEHIDEIETLCIQRGLQAFGLSHTEWSLNVQPYSGSPANLATLVGLLQPHDRIMGLGLPSGGHLTHGFYTAKRKVSASSIFFESLPYNVNKDGYIDYENLHSLAVVYKPKLIIAGLSSYPRDLDYKRFREICDECGAYLMVDMAHISGLIAAKLLNNPFEYADVVTSTTHKTLRGPRSGIIFTNIKKNPNLDQKINEAVFPALQGGPHNSTIAALAVQFKEVMSEEWKMYASQVKNNAQILAKTLIDFGYTLVTGGTENHIVLMNLSPNGINGNKLQMVCDKCNITLNKNSIQSDKSAATPSGVRLGTPAMTTRGLKEDDFVQVAQFLHKAIQICIDIQANYGVKLVDFKKGVENDDELQKLGDEVRSWASKFYMP